MPKTLAVVRNFLLPDYAKVLQGSAGALVLVAPHDPIPLLHQLNERIEGGLGIQYEERGPEAWRLRLTKV